MYLLNGRVKAAPASELTFKFGILWDKKKKLYCTSCLKKLEPHLFMHNTPVSPVYEIECIHCKTVHSITNDGVKADYYKIIDDV